VFLPSPGLPRRTACLTSPLDPHGNVKTPTERAGEFHEYMTLATFVATCIGPDSATLRPPKCREGVSESLS
jgi:hypothetical protein